MHKAKSPAWQERDVSFDNILESLMEFSDPLLYRMADRQKFIFGAFGYYMEKHEIS